MSTYQFRVDDGQPGAGEIVEVDFETMMNAEFGFLTLPDGRSARRINRPSEKKSTKKEKGVGPPIVSDAMGFTDNQLAQMETDRKANGFHGVEFRPDPMEPRFMQVHCSSERVKAAYMKHRGFTDQNSRNGSGAMLSPGLFEAARRRVIEEYGDASEDETAGIAGVDA